MNGLLNFEGYLSAVEAALRSLDIFKTVGIYSEMGDGYETPAVFFDIERWEESEACLGGNLTVNLACNFYIVRELAAEGYNRKIRNAALLFTGWIHQRQFGPGTGPAQFVSAESGNIYLDEKALASHHAWCVTIEQCVAVGMDPFDDTGAPTLKEVWMGISPDVGATHKDDYTLLARRGPDEEA
ncbi:hypothetical protein [Serratia quinivorans]|uniref:Uncharacterized protein n=1 Tax=Serratia quinivorans TaxID=137545 RepID=A0A379YFI5_9GAMM|nr:hypothetical protein [Serratia quinivorans]CAI1717461.1 Uncharacterised protein [Serratia quinivorans]SUI43915.1 Uncharacterised protein [Serratia quinivorans]